MVISKIVVSPGIQYVEVPEANLRVLCGCPADAVKHLRRRGLILSHEVRGVLCETGPNAILLSDNSLQNGEFANMAEFPVLQMLYKQGLLLPGHPNNTGRKPLLIGSADQVESQMKYIYRGNYGLVSEEELISAGAEPEQARDWMRMKLKFFNGKISPTADFLSAVVVGDGPVEVADGVTLRRLRPNLFEFSYKGESVTANLNLNPGEAYECPYTLGYRKFDPEYFAVIHSGDGDGWDDKRPAMSSFLSHQGSLYLIDAAPHIGNNMATLGVGIDQIDGIFHTHAHDDHFAGLTVLMRAGRRIKYYATSVVMASTVKKFAALLKLDEKNFSDFFDERHLVLNAWNNIDGMEVMPIFSPHPVETTVFLFRTLWGDGYRTYAHLADIASLDVLRGMVTEDENAPGISQKTFEQIRDAYLQKVDLKKIDVGGGPVHGDAKDFSDDKSTRILLAHRSTDLTPEEKVIGSSAAFGTVDVLVPEKAEGLRKHAFAYIEANLPGLPIHDLRMLLNHEITDVNPGTILLKEGESPQELMLVISGRVEKIHMREKVFGHVAIGSLIGDEAALTNQPSAHTYRAFSFVRVMRFPVGLYAGVVKRNALHSYMLKASVMKTFLNSTNLFGEGLPATVYSRILIAMTMKNFKANETISLRDSRRLGVIRSGEVLRMDGDKVFEALKEGDFFGEEDAVLNVPNRFTYVAKVDSTLLQLSGEQLVNTPVLRWKLLDSYQQRTVRALLGGGRPV
ncbi:MAG: cyclic nucleotide-binding domain-containing protein [Nitrospinae bacterium]|nr:cyclic nucleotide-binding domain-containing protein [Nitrospinota bacterium]